MYKRVLIKLSGEALLAGKIERFSLEKTICEKMAADLLGLQKKGVEVALVIGGGNIVRGREAKELGIERIAVDQMGMLATIINGIALKQIFEKEGCKVKLLGAFACHHFVEAYTPALAESYLLEGYMVLLVGGTGMPFFTTDTAAALRAVEIKAEVLLKATKVDGVYDKDPLLHSDAVRFDTITYQEVLDRSLAVMDLTATALCMDNRLPIIVFDLFTPHNLERVVEKEKIGTFVGRNV